MSKLDRLLDIEKDINIILWSSICFLIISGTWTWAISAHSQLSLWVGIFHGIAGVFFSFSIISFGIIHFRRTIGFRRPITLILGFFSWFILLGSIYSGTTMLWRGRTESDVSLHLSHIVLSYIAALLLIAHLLAYFWVVGKKQKSNDLFPSLDKRTRRNFAIVFASTWFILGICYLSSLLFNPNYTTQPIAGTYEYSYGPHPFRPSETETYHQTFIDIREIATSAECAVCHKDVADQWNDSTHKKAASDPTYVRNINLLATKKGIAATRYCEGCHAPIALLTGSLSPGGFHGGKPGTDANREGVNCLSCHGIQKLEHLKGNASYMFGPPEPYLFEGTSNSLLRALNRHSIRMSPNQHKKDMGRDFTAKSEFCATCHAQFMDKDMNSWGWVKMQDDYSAWLNGPFSGQNPRFNIAEPVNCQQCHMPKIPLNDPSSDVNGLVKSHRFVGANTLTAMLSDSPTQLEETIRFLQTNKIRITIDKPNRESATQNYTPLEKQERDQVTAPYYFYLNELAKLNVTVSNVGVGHNFPGGTIDINEAWIEIVVTDARGQRVFDSGLIKNNDEVDPNAYFYRSMPVDRKGKDVWRHDLFNMIGDRFRNAIPPGGADIASYQFTVPSWAVSPLQISSSVKYRKLNKKYTAWALENEKAALPIVDMARDSLTVPIKAQPDVEHSNQTK